MPASKLTPGERQVLEHAVAAGGTYTISGLSVSEMLRAAGAVMHLKSRGLVKGRFQFSRDIAGQPEAIAVEITTDGRRTLNTVPW
jgi:hypothetical protein